MTLGEGKKKCLMLIDEYSSGGEITQDIDINNKMNLFFDMAQKETNMYCPMHETASITLTGGWVDLPENFRAMVRMIDSDYRPVTDYTVMGKKVRSAREEEVQIEYLADVSTITESTADTYEFEIDDNMANCLPYYVAAQHLIVDLVVDYSALWNMYIQHRNEAAETANRGSAPRVRNTLFRG